MNSPSKENMSETDRIVQENIYRDVIEKIESLLSETSAEDISDARITTLYQETRNQLSSVSETLTKELQSLQEHSEWDSFTVAFYGETNAGKSTLVEALRILLNEETKIKERALYANTYKRLTALQNKSSMIEQEIKGLQEEKDNKTQELMASIGAATKALETIDDRLKYAIALIEANNLARADLRTNSTGDFFRVLLGKDEYSEKNGSLREEIPKLKLEYKECKSKIDIYNNNLESESEVFDLKIKPLEEEKIILDQEIAPLKVAAESHRDGQIIGTGQQDFTQDVTEYSFTINGQSLTLLDLPGIEGSESHYIDLIISALEKAHAVFYISKTPKPPQNGEDGISTISKVGKQLSGQTEVVFIYNKPAQNTKQIEDSSEISDDLQKSLGEVDQIMTAVLGDNYIGHFVICAMAAYLANSNNYGESETAKKLRKRQDKFLKQFTPEELKSKSNLDAIITWIEKNLASDYRGKIKEANYYKVINCLAETETEIEAIENKFKDLRIILTNELTASFKAIDARLNSMINELRDAKRTASHRFKIKSNEILYQEIDKGIDDDELSNKIKEVFDAQSRNSISLFNSKLKTLGEAYAKDVADINNKYQKYFLENIEVFNDTSKLGFEYEPIIDKHDKKNADALWIMGEIIGAVIFISTSSTAVLVMTILGLLIKVGRFIVKSIDPESNKAFQMQDLDLNVKNARTELENTLQSHNDIVIERIEENNQRIKERMEKSLEELDKSLTTLENARIGIRTIHEEYRNGGVASI